MEVRFKTNPARTIHLPPDLAEVLLLLPGTPLEKLPPVEPRKAEPRTRWSVGQMGYSLGSPLCITALCANCKSAMTWEGAGILKSASEDRNKFFHCGVREQVPKDILKRYAELVKQRAGQRAPRLVEQRPAFLNEQ